MGIIPIFLYNKFRRITSKQKKLKKILKKILTKTAKRVRINHQKKTEVK